MINNVDLYIFGQRITNKQLQFQLKLAIIIKLQTKRLEIL